MCRSVKPWQVFTLGFWLIAVPSSLAKEFLTPDEIFKIQEAQEVEKRIKIYMDAAALRLKTAEERLQGKESVAGDPLEFFTVQEMLDGYNRIIRSVMFPSSRADACRSFETYALPFETPIFTATTGAFPRARRNRCSSRPKASPQPRPWPDR